jgi:hypothetical protein
MQATSLAVSRGRRFSSTSADSVVVLLVVGSWTEETTSGFLGAGRSGAEKIKTNVSIVRSRNKVEK